MRAFAKGFRSGGFKRAGVNRTYKPDSVRTYELGTKNGRFLMVVSVSNTAVFWERLLGLSDFRQSPPGTTGWLPPPNVGKAKGQGS